jgi:hypothetical protein
MTVIRNYNDTKNELEIAKHRLSWLLERKERIYQRYCGVNTSTLNGVKVQTSKTNKDNMAVYLDKLDAKQQNGLSLNEEILHQEDTVKQLDYYINLMNNNLKQMKGLEYKLYYAIAVEGRSITGAIFDLSVNTGKSESTLWRIYRDKIEAEIKELEGKNERK